MKHPLLIPLVLLQSAVLSFAPRHAISQQSTDELRIDPLILVSVKEFRNIITTLGPEIFPGWNPRTTPVMLYRPGVQDILIGARRQPPGYVRYTGWSPLRGDVIYARNDSTLMSLDGQNTSVTFDSARILVVADRYSRMRNSLNALLRQPAERASRQLQEWGFIESPYDELGLFLHEGFHVYQSQLAPGKYADERSVALYPLLNPENNALVALEGYILRDALLAPTPALRRLKARQFVAVRAQRRSALDTASVSYENLNEFLEGMARYVELRFLQIGERVKPVPEMYYQNGFHGYSGALRHELERRAQDMVKLASNSDDRFGNRFGGGPLRFRLYATGAAQGLLLDEAAPDWKRKIFAPGVYLTDLLAQALPVTAAERDSLIESARRQYGYDSLIANRRAFQEEGLRVVLAKRDAILNTAKTLVTIDYSAAPGELTLGYTPFGVTAVERDVAIYDLVPVAVRFPNGTVLRMKSTNPVLIDKGAHTVTFAVDTPAGEMHIGDAKLDVTEFGLTKLRGSISVAGTHAVIKLLSAGAN